MSWKLKLAAGAGLLVLAACNPGSYPVDIFPEMHYEPNHRRLEPQRLHAAPDAVPVANARVAYSYSEARDLHSPSPADARQAAQLYMANCAVCHGMAGHGDGSVAKYFKDNPTAPVPPSDLTSQLVQRHTDGELYWIVANGVGNMPAFGDELTDEQLWAVVGELRQLASQP